MYPSQGQLNVANETFGGFGLYPPMEGSWDGCRAEDMTEEEFREWLDRSFRVLFDPYEMQGGIPCKDLLAMFQYRDHGLPRERRNELILKMDSNRDGRITFEEFRTSLVKLRYQDLSLFNRFGMRAVLAGNPGLRLHAAKLQARHHLAAVEAAGRTGTFVAIVPDPLRGGVSVGRHGFELEPDGVWPCSSRRDVNPSATSSTSLVTRKTIRDEEYVPESYLKAYNCRPPPIFIPICVIVQISVFIYYAVELNKRAEYEPRNRLTWTSGFPYFSPLYYDPRRRAEAWRFLTYMFVHEGILHLLLNCLLTLLLGILIEWVHKFWRVMPVYFAGVLAGSLASSILDTSALLAGSSGGAYALLGTHLALVVINWEELQHDATHCKSSLLSFLSSGVVRLVIIFIYLAVDFSVALFRRYGLQEEVTVSFVAHLAGFIAGILMGIPLLRNIRQKPWERVMFWIALGLYAAFLIFAIFWNIFWPGFPEQTS